MRKISLLFGAVLIAKNAIADNPFDVYFDSTVPFMENSETIIFDGMRVEGAGLSASDDALRLKYDFDYNTLNFNLNKKEITVYSNVGVFNQEHMAINASVSQPDFLVDGIIYQFNEEDNFEATSSEPFIAELNLETGHVVSFFIDGQSNKYSFEFTGKNIDSVFLGEANQSIISGAHKILRNGNYRLKIIPTDSLTLTFSIKLFNANNHLIQDLANNDRVSVSFENNIRDYAKYKINLKVGDKLNLAQPSSSIRLKLVDSLGKEVTSTVGLALIYVAEKEEEFYLFIDEQNGHGGSYNSTVLIESASQPRSRKQIFHKTYDKANLAMPIYKLSK